KIGFIGGDLKHPSIAERYEAYCHTLEARGIDIPTSWKSIDEPDTRIDNGYRAAKQILTHAAERPTAVFAANDALALGCMKYCREVGLPIPDSLAIVGFDNVEAGLYVEPRLSSVNVHREEMGSVAVRRLVEMIRDRNDVVSRTTTTVELVIRESCGGKRDLHLGEIANASV
ncbi:MAG: substrate-binding domain-containing protein, partial [Bacteroidota bacterium]